MGKRSWWQRSLDGRFRLLKARNTRGLEPRQRIEWTTMTQKDQATEHVEKAHEIIFETVTRIDLVERKRIAKDLAWKAKWDMRRARFRKLTEK